MDLRDSLSSQSQICSKNVKMAKFALIILALVAIQGCYGTSLAQPKLTEVEQAVNEFAIAMKDINGILSFISGHLSSVARDYEYQMDDIYKKHPIYPTITELRDTILNLESEATDNSKNCFDTAWAMTLLATKDMKIKIDGCISEARTMGSHILSVLETVDRKAFEVESDIVDGFKMCMQQGGTDNYVAKCLRNLIKPLQEELATLKIDVNNANEHIVKDISDSTRNLNICLQHVKRDVTKASENIVDNVNRCIKVKFISHPASNKNYAKSEKGILDIFQEMKEKIKNIIHIVSHLPTSIEEIPDKINEIISHINISALYSQLKSEVHDIIADGGRNAEKCRPEADQRLDDIVKAAEDESKLCMAATEGKVESVEAEFELLVTDAKQLLSDINKQILQCYLDNKLNPIGLAKCLKEHYETYKERISVLQEIVTETVEKTKLEAHELLETLASCVNKVQLDTVKNGQVLITDVEECVRTA